MELTTKQKNAFAKKGVTNKYHLRRWYPLRYIDNSTETGIDLSLLGMHVTIVGRLAGTEKKRMKARPLDYIRALYKDRKSGEEFYVNYLGNFYEYSTLNRYIGDEFIVSGILQYFDNFGFVVNNPEVTSRNIEENMRVVPVYSKVKGISAENVEKIIMDSLTEKEEETVSDVILDEFGLVDINTAITGIISPKEMKDVAAAKNRLLFDDFLYLAGRLSLMDDDNIPGIKASSEKLVDTALSNIPYSLTGDQRKVYEEIRNKMYQSKHINCLVQGDVGAGKTIVAFLTMILTAEAGYQAILMAPTQILAQQHYDGIQDVLKGTGLNSIFISGNSKPTKEELKQIENGDIQLIIGTTAILSDKIKLCNPGLFVIDEEHRFGVEQRNAIDKQKAYTNSISMSATPIPRTLASALFGDNTEVYNIKEKPAGRKPIKTYYDDGKKTASFVMKVLESGHQAYMVCPMIDDNDSDLMKDVYSTHQVYEMMKKFLKGRFNVAELTGSTSARDTEQILDDFRNNKIQLLISTTVVEVGVNVPNATLMVIVNAERFGLAGMHQLRGRVGRGDAQSYCILMSKQSPAQNERLMTLCQTDDGFEIAEKDMLYLRKSGDLFGTEQSGKNRYIEEMYMFNDFYNRVKDTVKKIPKEQIQKHIDKMIMCENPRKTFLR